MKTGPYTTTLTIELELFSNNGDDVEYKEFDVEFVADWENDGLGWTEAWGHRTYHKGTDFLTMRDWKILEQMTEEYDPLGDCEY